MKNTVWINRYPKSLVSKNYVEGKPYNTKEGTVTPKLFFVTFNLAGYGYDPIWRTILVDERCIIASKDYKTKKELEDKVNIALDGDYNYKLAYTVKKDDGKWETKYDAKTVKGSRLVEIIEQRKKEYLAMNKKESTKEGY